MDWISGMVFSPIGRGRFFVYSVILILIEIAATIICVDFVIGLEEFIDSKPGPERGIIFFPILFVMLFLFVFYSIIALRRAKDGNIRKLLIFGYIFTLFLFTVLQVLIFMIYDFDKGYQNVGFTMVCVALGGLWFRIWLAPSAGVRGKAQPVMQDSYEDREVERIVAAFPSASLRSQAVMRASEPSRNSKPGFGKRTKF